MRFPRFSDVTETLRAKYQQFRKNVFFSKKETNKRVFRLGTLLGVAFTLCTPFVGIAARFWIICLLSR